MERRSAGERSPVSASARTRLLAPVLALLGLVIAGLVAAAPASAGIKQDFEVFNQCPLGNPAVTVCVYSTTTSGEFHLGNASVPVSKTVVLQGGLKGTEPELVPAANGETLSKTSLPVPGGLLGIELLGNLTEVSTTAELAGPVDVFLSGFGKREGTAVALPVKAKLENPLLGSTCSIGNDSEPIMLNLTTGTTNPPGPNEPISGTPGTLEFGGAGKINVFRNSSLVDNAFAAPGASGCAEPLSLVVDASVDLKEGLPAAAGKNTAILSGTLEQSGAATVRAVDALPEIGRCVKAPSEKVERKLVYRGLYADAGCTFEEPQKEGKFEWVPGAEAKHFTGSAKAVSLETFGKQKIACTEESTTGEYTGLKTATLGITLTGCTHTSNKEPCHSEGAGSGQIAIPSLQAELGFIKDVHEATGTVALLGWDLKRGSTFASAVCGGSEETLNVTGSVIAPISAVDKMVSAYTLALKQKGGVQAPESFEEEPTDVLHASLGSSNVEQAGLGGSLKVTNEEKLEFKALAE